MNEKKNTPTDNKEVPSPSEMVSNRTDFEKDTIASLLEPSPTTVRVDQRAFFFRTQSGKRGLDGADVIKCIS